MSSRRAGDQSPILSQPEIPFVSFDLVQLLEDVRVERVPEAPAGIHVGFHDQRHLARIVRRGEQWQGIGIHPILNRRDTPVEVARFILMHELLHTVFPARVVGARFLSHPPEFQEEELRRSPPGERTRVWQWIHACLGSWVRPRGGGLTVLVKWKASLAEPLRTVDEVEQHNRSIDRAVQDILDEWRGARPFEAWGEAA